MTIGNLRSPKWIVSHVLMATAVVVMVLLGLWQLERLGERRDRNAEIEARTAQPVAAIEDLVAATDPYSVGATLRFRPVTAGGTYQVADEVVVRNRSLGGSAGYWLLTPLLLDDGSAVVVNRGWIPFSMGAAGSRAGAEAPASEVQISGIVQQTVTAGLLQIDDAAEGVLDSLARVDLERYGQQLDYQVVPVFIQLESQLPAQADVLPVMLARPELDEGPHLSYAVQWFVFATIAGVGYLLVLGRLAERDGRPKRPSQVPIDYL